MDNTADREEGEVLLLALELQRICTWDRSRESFEEIKSFVAQNMDTNRSVDENKRILVQQYRRECKKKKMKVQKITSALGRT